MSHNSFSNLSHQEQGEIALVILSFYTIYSNLKHELMSDDVLNDTNHPYKCNVCPFVTLLPTVLREHMLVHSVERPYKCPVCNKGFTQKGSVQLHMLHHTGERPHKCPVCHRCYSQKGSMRRHILQHLSNNSNKCPLCSENFELRSEVEVHLIQHTKKTHFIAVFARLHLPAPAIWKNTTKYTICL
ncbi:hypothetical protein CEXT_274671 [Caerostris extrusa]|uniref:C2H2-type domain-containing protein n=1 Tax=Caerostris extrusa TaxID=172846 RepID=A0AAV4R9V7_CAEEX|nr:hypothetical protein CEXT_274671 [Caerostris extrusa]